jgi:hypothetical protein
LPFIFLRNVANIVMAGRPPRAIWCQGGIFSNNAPFQAARHCNLEYITVRFRRAKINLRRAALSVDAVFATLVMILL